MYMAIHDAWLWIWLRQRLNCTTAQLHGCHPFLGYMYPMREEEGNLDRG
jgi:hypothetical protein